MTQFFERSLKARPRSFAKRMCAIFLLISLVRHISVLFRVKTLFGLHFEKLFATTQAESWKLVFLSSVEFLCRPVSGLESDHNCGLFVYQSGVRWNESTVARTSIFGCGRRTEQSNTKSDFEFANSQDWGIVWLGENPRAANCNLLDIGGCGRLPRTSLVQTMGFWSFSQKVTPNQPKILPFDQNTFYLCFQQ